MTAICWALAVLFAWCVITAGHASYQVAPAPAVAVTETAPANPPTKQG